MFLETFVFLQCCPVCWHIIVHSIFLWVFVFFLFLQYRCDVSSFSYYFIYSDALSLLPWEPGQKLVDFVYRLNELAFGFIDFYFCFLISVLFISSLIFIISFLLLTLGFVCSFFLLILLGVR